MPESKEIKWEEMKDHIGKWVVMEHRGHLEEVLVEYFEKNVLGFTVGECKIFITPNPNWKDEPEIKIFTHG